MDSRYGGSPNGDGTPNLVDNDDDGDGIPDVQHAHPYLRDAAAIVVVRRPARRPQVKPVLPPEP